MEIFEEPLGEAYQDEDFAGLSEVQAGNLAAYGEDQPLQSSNNYTVQSTSQVNNIVAEEDADSEEERFCNVNKTRSIFLLVITGNPFWAASFTTH